jgi:hypothetical protein
MTRQEVIGRLCDLADEVAREEFQSTQEIDPFNERHDLADDELATQVVEFIEKATHQVLANRKLAREKGVM